MLKVMLAYYCAACRIAITCGILLCSNTCRTFCALCMSVSWDLIECQSAILTYNDRTVTHIHIKWGVALGSTVIGAGTRQPALAQTYATVVFGEGRVPGEQMLTVGRGLWTTATIRSVAGVSGLRPGRHYLWYYVTVQAPSTLPCGRDAGS